MTQTKNNNIEKDDEVFETILRKIETRMSEKILNTMYGAIKTNEERNDGYYIIQWTSEMYTLQEDIEIEYYKPTITTYEGEIVCNTVFINLVPNTEC